MQRLLVITIEYLLGFLALAVFAGYAFAQGAPTDERWITAFKIGGCLGAVELLVLYKRKTLANWLIVGANLWLVIGAVAAFTEQWWLLQGYQNYGEASLFATMFFVGLVATAYMPGGFIGASGSPQKIFYASMALLTAVAVALAVAVVYKGNVKLAAVFPVIALSWLNRALKRYAQSGA